MKIEQVTKDDEAWIKELFEVNSYILGGFGLTWHMFWKNKKPNEFWIKIGTEAFARYLIKKNGSGVTLYEIAVKTKRKGYGSALMKYMGTPMQLKTDADNEESNAFYEKLGFICRGKKKSKNGKKEFNIYKKW